MKGSPPTIGQEAREVAGKLMRREPGFEASATSLLRRAARALTPFGFRQLIRELAMRGRSEVVDDFGFDPAYAERVQPVLEFLYRSYFRVETLWIDRVPSSGRGLIVANHSGGLPYDGAMLLAALRLDHPSGRSVRPLIEDLVFHAPYLGVIMNRIGGVRACQENAQRLLEREELVAVFPEGVKGIGKLYRERYQLQRFGRGGFVKLALRTRTPIIPTAIVGAEEVHPMMGRVTWMARSLGLPYVPVTPTFPLLGPLGLIPVPTKWRIAFSEPIDFSKDHGPEAAEDRTLVVKLAEEVRQTVQLMVDDLLAVRRSVLFG